MGTTRKHRFRKRKLALKDITLSHPRHQSRHGRSLPQPIYSEIATKLHSNVKHVYEAAGCKSGEDHCLLDKSPIDETQKKVLRKEYLRPLRPKAWDSDPDMWLDNFNIIHVMKQYQETYKWFTFLGVFPIDFSAPDPYATEKKCLNKEICELNLLKEYENDKRGIGMIFNLDPHYKGGSHWVGLYIDIKNIKKPFISYFDSYGYPTPSLIARLMRSFKLQVKTCQLGRNSRRFQYGDSECGMFSMYFIICMMHGIPFKEFCKDSVSDDFMLQLRKILFSK
jgi:hypothetical protein